MLLNLCPGFKGAMLIPFLWVVGHLIGQRISHGVSRVRNRLRIRPLRSPVLNVPAMFRLTSVKAMVRPGNSPPNGVPLYNRREAG